jgi:hypothetical protein
MTAKLSLRELRESTITIAGQISMHLPDPQPQLRLVGADDSAVHRSAALAHHHRAIAAENRAASGNRALQPTDPRWVLAARAYGQLQGSTLTPERRERVMRTAKTLGIRPFDANVIIAIVQDNARRGQPLGVAQPILELIDRPMPPGADRSIWTRWIGAVVLAAMANLILIWWLLSA